MRRTAIIVASVATGLLALAGPASAAGTYAGVYPSHAAASKACADGKAQGRWSSCMYRAAVPGPNPPVELWVS
ncbi:hypothetical protein ACL03H_07325 [Saccharopolyspora sp. MS10]|uniref:hypothetical protein n=1 Tax=Saccharopolyspora sp. MS10 TaxID=3385973 RepID=UPI00399F2867